MPKTVHLHTPITEEQIRSLELDDIVYVSGDAYCMLYADHYTLIMDMLDRGEEIPMDLKDSVIYNTGVIWRRTPEGGYDMRALGATTSSKFNAQTPSFIAKTGIRAIIGKGGMDKACLEAMKEYGCAYLAICGRRLYTGRQDRGRLLARADAHGQSAAQVRAQRVRPAVRRHGRAWKQPL